MYVLIVVFAVEFSIEELFSGNSVSVLLDTVSV
jgi:hypothetical protein